MSFFSCDSFSFYLSILGSVTADKVTPIRSLANIGVGLADLLLEPLSQYRSGKAQLATWPPTHAQRELEPVVYLQGNTFMER